MAINNVASERFWGQWKSQMTGVPVTSGNFWEQCNIPIAEILPMCESVKDVGQGNEGCPIYAHCNGPNMTEQNSEMVVSTRSHLKHYNTQNKN